MIDYVSDMSFLCGAERVVFDDGKSRGVRAVRVFNGKLDFYIIPDRGMDIWRLTYKGENVSYVSVNGMVSPRLALSGGYDYKNSFPGGFLYTCGPDNISAPAEVGGRTRPMHGSGSFYPAENLSVRGEYEGSGYRLSVTGEIGLTALFGEKLTIRRTVSVTYLGNDIEIKDEYINRSYENGGYMVMYHTNFGYPFLAENARLSVNAASTVGYSGEDAAGAFVFAPPKAGAGEECYLHTLKEGCGPHAAVENERLRVEMTFDSAKLPYLLEWKYLSAGDYALGLEPLSTKLPQKTFRPLPPKSSETTGVKYTFIDKK